MMINENIVQYADDIARKLKTLISFSIIHMLY